MPNIRWLLALITRVHRFVYRISGGRVGHRLPGMRVLMLTTVGRKSGLVRTLPLLYVPDGERFVVVASNAGDDRDPAWWLNLRARPEAEIQVGPRRLHVKAHQASVKESERLWPLLTASYRHYPEYRERTQRDIPIVILESA